MKSTKGSSNFTKIDRVQNILINNMKCCQSVSVSITPMDVYTYLQFKNSEDGRYEVLTIFDLLPAWMV